MHPPDNELYPIGTNILNNKIMSYILDTKYYLSTEGYSFMYREDRYDKNTIHVEMFRDGEKVHKQMAKSINYGVDKTHHQIINELESKIMLNQLDPTGLKQTV
jgi:hypothetical protein